MTENSFNFENSIDIDRLARLSRLEIGEKEREIVASELKKMADYTYPRVKCGDGALPFSYDHSKATPRPDEALLSPNVDRTLLLENAPSSREGYITVPKIIAEEDGNE